MATKFLLRLVGYVKDARLKLSALGISSSKVHFTMPCRIVRYMRICILPI